MEPQPEELEDWIDETQQKIFKVAVRVEGKAHETTYRPW
jgi:hypothetical protein